MSYENYLEGINNIKSRYGTIQQVDLDGTLSGGVITFVPDTNFAPTNNMMYKFVLTFSAVARPTFDSEMVLNLDGTNNLPILSIFNKSTATNTTVQQMKEVEEYNNETGFKWVFLAIYNEVENGGTITRAVSIPASLSNPQGFILVVDDDQITHYTMDGGLLNGQVVFNEDSGKFLKFTTDGTNHSFTEYVIAPTSLPATGAKLSGSIPNTVAGGLELVTATYDYVGEAGSYINTAFSMNISVGDSIKATAQNGSTFTSTAIDEGGGIIRVSGFPVSGNNKLNLYFNAIRSGNTNIYQAGSLVIYVGVGYPQFGTGVYQNLSSPSNFYNYTISNVAIKANTLAEMYVNSETPITAVSKADGSLVVSVLSLPSAAIPYTLQVVETSAEGAFEIINSYVPTVKVFTNTAVAVADFVADTTYTGYGYRATIALGGVTASMVAEVVFGLTEAVSGNYAPVAETYAGGVYIYATEAPASAITIPTITVMEG